MTQKKFFLDLSFQDWLNWAQSNRLPHYRAKQIFEWIYKKMAICAEEMGNLPKEIQALLNESIDFTMPTTDSALVSRDLSVKFLLKTADHRYIESVLMPTESRMTLCISSQVGCKMACTFCQTGKLGLMRHLSSGEILAQVLIANRYIKKEGLDRLVSNVVFMGMGEPLDNYTAVVQSLKILLAEEGFHLSKNKVTVSTCGLIPEIQRLGEEVEVSLAISLHSADEEQRSKMMPINKKYSLKALKEALLNYPMTTRHGITFEYVMIKGENDSLADAKKLVRFLHGLKAKVNLIPMNSHPGTTMESSEDANLKAFQSYLAHRSIPAPIRYSRGQDISGACGQLALKKEKEIDLFPKDVARLRREEFREAHV